ncbi:unnamed protein product [Ciceribacter sp. T2.26MG-112.2]|nr:unnamed protein product [Ciceribacter naphthalenivorans]
MPRNYILRGPRVAIWHRTRSITRTLAEQVRAILDMRLRPVV